MQEKTENNQEDSFGQRQSAGSGSLPESLSALMDDEAGDLELRRVLREMASGQPGQQDLMERWQRYHLVQASLRHELGHIPAVSLLAGIHARLEAEGPALGRPSSRRSGSAVQFRNLMRKLGQGAVAASVATLVLYGASRIGLNPEQSGLGIADSSSSGQESRLSAEAGTLPELAGDYNPSELTRTVSMGSAERDRIQRAVQQFSGAAPRAAFSEAYTFPIQPENAEEQAREQ